MERPISSLKSRKISRTTPCLSITSMAGSERMPKAECTAWLARAMGVEAGSLAKFTEAAEES